MAAKPLCRWWLLTRRLHALPPSRRKREMPCAATLIRLVALLLSILPAHAQKIDMTLAATPPMGWNSWDSYGLTVTQQQFQANAAVLRDKLKPFGWNYAVVDEGWYMENPEQRPHPEKLVFALDPHGRFLPAVSRFPLLASPRLNGTARS